MRYTFPHSLATRPFRTRRVIPWLLAGAYVLGASPLAAQPVTQKVTGPKTRYWLSAETSSGFMARAASASGGGLSAMMGALTGAGGGAQRSLQLDLGSVREGADLTADHSIPGGMNLGPILPLIGPEKAQPRREDGERDIPEQRERPEGNARLLFFWGCGDSVGPDQPVVLDMKQIMDGRLPPNMQSFNVNMGPNPPSVGRDKTYVGWPNRRDNKPVPSGASLVGEHKVQGPATVDVPFAVAATHDFMDAVNLNSEVAASGGLRLGWNTVGNALGYFSTAMGVRPTGDKSVDMVMWNSSTKRMLGGERLLRFLPPAEVARLERESVVMPASQTECTIPKGVLDAAGGNMTMLNLNAFGPELNLVHPPRPQDPKVDWNQEYTVKLRLHSYTSTIAGMPGGMSGGMPGGRPGNRPAVEGAPTQAPAEAAPRPNLPNPIGEGVNLLKGLFGR